MIKYHELLENISNQELLEKLISHGLFNDKMPPFLQSKDFFKYYSDINIKFTKNMKEPKKYILYENYRNINIPRQLAIPNPFSYILQCESLSKNWSKYISHFKKLSENHNYKISRIHIRKQSKTPALFEMNYSNFNIDGNPDIDLLVGAKYKVSADISNCFPSIYTHSIAWSLITKQEAKNYKSNKYRNCWFNEIDLFTRNMKEGETHGLLIGPHTSNLLAEVILCTIDDKLYSEGWKFIRNIDDYTCHTTSIDNSNNFLYSLQSHLRNYGLNLNHKKTKVNKLPEETEDTWIRLISSFSIHQNNKLIDYKLCKSYLNLAINLAEKENNIAIINYATKVLDKSRLTNNAKKYLTKIWFHLSIIYPYLLPILDKQILSLKQFNTDELTYFLSEIYHSNYKINNYEGISYALFFAIKYNVDILNSEIFKELTKCNDCILLTLLFLYGESFKYIKGVKELKKIAKTFQRDSFDSYWLFIYEILSKDELSIAEWKNLKKNGVSFIDYEFNLYSIFNTYDFLHSSAL